VPTAFISGITGELYKQFALTIAVSTAFSGLNALTFTPAMCALFLKPRHEQSNFFVYKWFNRIFGKVTDGYVGIVGRMLRRPALAVVIFCGIIAVAFYGFGKLPTSYVPQEDMGYFMTSVQLPTGASLERTDSIMRKLSAEIKAIPEVKNVLSVSGQSFIGGGSASNLGSLFIVLKPWKERKGKDQSVDAVIAHVNEITAPIQEALIFSINPPAIQGLGMTSGAQMQLLDINNYGADEMAKTVAAMQQAAAKSDKLASITSMYEGNVPQYTVKINRDKVKMSQVSINDVYTTLSAFMGGTYVNDYVEFGRVYEVQISADGKARNTPADVLSLTVANAAGEMVPFGSFATVEPTMGQANIARYNMYNTASVTGTPAHGVSSSEAIAEMETILQDVAGTNFAYAWTGEAYQETQAGTTVSMVLIFAIIMTILVLAAQYESWTDPLAVVVTAPTAILGTVLGCLLMAQSVSIYTQIGIVLLIGMAAKNAILIVEFATDYRRSGEPIREAAINAGRVRFRPIMMTSLAFIFGVMPMLFATGAGAASRISLGAAVVFGMAVNAVLGTLFIPNFWELLQRLSERFHKK
jgi:hydrophobe/amphiphile efflux-1 (HAE1) family protein